MKKPASYPKTDVAENRAVIVLNNKLDVNQTKADIKTRDKVPNTDGTIELVDNDRVPIGKVEVQVKAIPNGDTQYPCSTSLVAYSETITLPFILICVDHVLEKVYWKHIFPFMPELKPDQDSFTIYFDPVQDGIGETSPYISRWKHLVFDYQERINQYPLLKEESEAQQKLSTINKSHLVWLQRYIDTVNFVFDYQFSSLKTILMPGIWKLGLGIRGFDDEFLSYNIHRIPYGDLTPLLVHLKNDQIKKQEFFSQNDRTITSRAISISHVIDKSNPVDVAMKDAYQVVQNAIKQNTYRIFGTTISSEILFDFLDDYSFCFGLDSGNSYQVSELAEGLYRYFPVWCYLASKNKMDSSHPIIDFESLSESVNLEEKVQIDRQVKDILASRESIPTILISSNRYSLNLVSNAVEYLMGKRIFKIKRPYPIVGNRIKGRLLKEEEYSLADFNKKIEIILEQSIYEYEEFVIGNRIKYPDKGVTDSSHAVVYTYEIDSDSWGDFIEINFKRFVIDNRKENFSKVTFVDPKMISMEDSLDNDDFSLLINGIDVKIIRATHTGFSQLNYQTPMLSYIYSLMWDDMEINFGLGEVFIHSPNLDVIPASL